MRVKEPREQTQTELEFELHFQEARNALHRVLDTDYRGTIGRALHLGNAAAMALQVIDGNHWIDAPVYKLRRTK